MKWSINQSAGFGLVPFILTPYGLLALH